MKCHSTRRYLRRLQPTRPPVVHAVPPISGSYKMFHGLSAAFAAPVRSGPGTGRSRTTHAPRHLDNTETGTWSVNRPAHISMNCGHRVRGFCPRHHSRTGYYRSVLIQIRLTQKRFTFLFVLSLLLLLSVIKKTVKCSYKQINKTKWEFNSKTKTISCKKLCFPTVRQNKVNSVNIKFFFFKFRKTLKCNPQS